MIKIILLVISTVIFSMCMTNQQLNSTYKFAKENRNMNKRPGYEGLPTTVTAHAKIDCNLILETYENFCFIEKYNFTLKKGERLDTAIVPDAYYITIVIDSVTYNEYVFNTYAPAHKVDLTNWVDNAIVRNKHNFNN